MHPCLPSLDLGDARTKVQGLIHRSWFQIGDIQVAGNVANTRRSADPSSLSSISMRDGEIQTMTINQGGNDATVDDLLSSPAVMRLSFPGGHRFVAVPKALDLQTLFIIRAAAVTMTDGTLVLKSLFTHILKQSLFVLVQFQRSRIYTIAKIGWLRPVVKDMAQMSIAFVA